MPYSFLWHPVTAKAPKRSVASESRYSLVEFMRDFPDDETCLRWLWNTRYNLGRRHGPL